MPAHVRFVRHAARCSSAHPPSSLAGIRACLAAGAELVEVDIQALAGGDYALLHDALLEESTTGRGPTGLHTAAQVRKLGLTLGGAATGERVALLSQVVEILQSEPLPVELQLDLKVHPTAPGAEAQLGELARLVAPLGNRVRVSSTADWVLRRLHALAPHLALGFDPLLYLDRREPDPAPPFRTGAYGYRDDHPLAAVCWGPPHEYLLERAEALWAQVPFAGVWYIRGTMLAAALSDGFDWTAFLHARRALVTAWTLDAARPSDVETVQRLIAAGVDRITTNDAPALAAALGLEA